MSISSMANGDIANAFVTAASRFGNKYHFSPILDLLISCVPFPPPLGYTSNSSVANGDIANVFATAAFRFGHSQVGDHVLLSDPTLEHQELVPMSQVV